jgi:hypothetical protein
LAATLRRPGESDRIAGWLRDEFGHADPPLWTIGVDVEPAAVLPAAWYEQESLLGAYLRAIREVQTEDRVLEMDGLVPPRLREGAWAERWKRQDAARRRRILREAAELGVALLGENKAPPAEKIAGHGASPVKEVAA